MPGQGQFIQMLATLAQIQQGRQELSLKERQFGATQKQWADQLKQLTRETQNKELSEALKLFADAAPDAREGLLTILNARDIPEEFKAGARAYAQGQPISQAVQAAMSSQKGYAAMSPGEQAPVDRESATVARTGLNQGQLMQSQTGAAALGGNRTPIERLENLYGPEMTQQLIEGFASSTMARQTPFQMQVDASARTAGLAPQQAAAEYSARDTQYGPMRPAQVGQIDVARGGVQAQMAGVQADMMRAIAAAKNDPGAGADIARMANIVEQMTGKNATKEGNTALAAQYNSLARLHGLPLFSSKDDLPGRANFLLRMFMGAKGNVPANGQQPVAQPRSNMLGAPPTPSNPMSYFAPPVPQGFNPFSPSRP